MVKNREQMRWKKVINIEAETDGWMPCLSWWWWHFHTILLSHIKLPPPQQCCLLFLSHTYTHAHTFGVIIKSSADKKLFSSCYFSFFCLFLYGNFFVFYSPARQITSFISSFWYFLFLWEKFIAFWWNFLLHFHVTTEIFKFSRFFFPIKKNKFRIKIKT